MRIRRTSQTSVLRGHFLARAPNDLELVGTSQTNPGCRRMGERLWRIRARGWLGLVTCAAAVASTAQSWEARALVPEWQSVEQMPTPRQNQASAVAGGRWYVAG